MQQKKHQIQKDTSLVIKWKTQSKILYKLCISQKLQNTLIWKTSKIELLIIVMLFETKLFLVHLMN